MAKKDVKVLARCCTARVVAGRLLWQYTGMWVSVVSSAVV